MNDHLAAAVAHIDASRASLCCRCSRRTSADELVRAVKLGFVGAASTGRPGRFSITRVTTACWRRRSTRCADPNSSASGAGSGAAGLLLGYRAGSARVLEAADEVGTRRRASTFCVRAAGTLDRHPKLADHRPYGRDAARHAGADDVFSLDIGHLQRTVSRTSRSGVADDERHWRAAVPGGAADVRCRPICFPSTAHTRRAPRAARSSTACRWRPPTWPSSRTPTRTRS